MYGAGSNSDDIANLRHPNIPKRIEIEQAIDIDESVAFQIGVYHCF